MATGTIYHHQQLGFTPTVSFRVGIPAYTKTVYLHNDGSWHTSPQHPNNIHLWPGYFPTHEEAQLALDNATQPNSYAHVVRPNIQTCPKCHHVEFDGLDNHECPSQEYLNTLKEIIRQAYDHEEARDPSDDGPTHITLTRAQFNSLKP